MTRLLRIAILAGLFGWIVSHLGADVAMDWMTYGPEGTAPAAIGLGFLVLYPLVGIWQVSRAWRLRRQRVASS